MQALQSKLTSLPNKPGIYLFKDNSGKVIYVGKARSLKSRVKNYFQDSRFLDPKSQSLVKRVADLETIITGNETEALFWKLT